MSDNLVFAPTEAAKARTLTTKAQYDEMYARSIQNPDSFWAEQAQRLDWIKAPTIIKNTSFNYPDISIKWFEDGVLNVSYNCVDRHLATRGDQVAILWEGDTPGTDGKVTYRELHERVCRFANVLKANGVVKGDRVTIYMPMVIDTAVAMLACARIGAVHSVIFGGFSPDSIAG
ncbi:MAG TPA: AMP-binding protein, partial [Devosia sp.]|nr:AMP-binding protein [Devosia sp.]